MLKLIYNSCTICNRTFPCLGQSAQFSCRPLGNNQRQSMAKADDVGNHTRIFVVCLIRRITRQLFNLKFLGQSSPNSALTH